MLNKFMVTLLLILPHTFAVASYYSGDEQCKGSHEIYLTCGPACQADCDNFMYELECNKPCVSGCFCEEGYVRNIKFKCVKESACDSDSDSEEYECALPNEIYRKCGTECPDTCDNYFIQHTCNRKCVEGCFCLPGYVRDDIGFCILPKDCPPPGITTPPKPICRKENETYSLCGTRCPETCDNYGETISCKKKCIAGCFCNKGYVRDYNNACILIEDCPEQAPPIIVDPASSCNWPFEEYSKCGTSCPKTCSNYNDTILCPIECKEGCFCRTGLVRNKKNNCVYPEECPITEDIKCRYLEQPATKERPCSGTCDEPGRCIPADDLNHCVCIPGTVQDDYGQCIFPEFCPVGCYDANEVFDCGSPCEVECKTLGKECKKHSFQCIAQCYCRNGYARDHRGKCVPIKYCPVKTPILDIFYKITKYMLT